MCNEPVHLNWASSRQDTGPVKRLSSLPLFVLPQVDKMSKAVLMSGANAPCIPSSFNFLSPRLDICLLSNNAECFLKATDDTMGSL